MKAFDTAVIFQAAVIDDLILGSAIQHFKEDVTESINVYILNNEVFLSRFIKIARIEILLRHSSDSF